MIRFTKTAMNFRSISKRFQPPVDSFHAFVVEYYQKVDNI